jgi:hypothetical protein
MPSRMKEDITCISEYSKFSGCKYPCYPNGCCKTLVESRLVIKVNCLLTLFIVNFANGLGARTDFGYWNAVISVVPAANKVVSEKVSTVDVNMSTVKYSSCINQCLQHISTP